MTTELLDLEVVELIAPYDERAIAAAGSSSCCCSCCCCSAFSGAIVG